LRNQIKKGVLPGRIINNCGIKTRQDENIRRSYSVPSLACMLIKKNHDIEEQRTRLILYLTVVSHMGFHCKSRDDDLKGIVTQSP
ncbi:MAG: hypothetical protein PHT96_03340, partial [Syntrophorhabdaceae bacterium]|nr:hypothetical protein [Syntrophorhabdaceae bacterium]